MGNNRSARPPYKPTIATTSQVEALAEHINVLETRLEDTLNRVGGILQGFDARQGITEYALEKLIQDLYGAENEGEPEVTDEEISAIVGEPGDDSGVALDPAADSGVALDPAADSDARYGAEQRAAAREAARLVVEADFEGEGGALSPAERANEG